MCQYSTLLIVTILFVQGATAAAADTGSAPAAEKKEEKKKEESDHESDDDMGFGKQVWNILLYFDVVMIIKSDDEYRALPRFIWQGYYL